MTGLNESLLCHHSVYLYIKGCINRDFGLIIWNRFGVALLLYCSMATIPNNDLSATSEGTFFFLIKSDKSLLEIGQKSELDFVSVKYLKKKMDSWAQNITRFIALNAIGKFYEFNWGGHNFGGPKNDHEIVVHLKWSWIFHISG